MGARILVIEDNPVNMELMTCVLQAWQHEVLPAGDGDQGMAIARECQPDLVICDIQLPGMDGYEVTRRMRADPALRDLPLVAVTAYAMVSDRDKAIAAGFDLHVPKPIDPAAFVTRLESLLPGRTGAPVSRGGALGSDTRRVPDHLLSPRRPCVLLTVDDEPAYVEFKAELLRAAGYELVAASRVRDALGLLASRPVDLVLSDAVMPDGGGFELLRRLRADAATRDLPFVFLTASVRDESSRRLGLELGANDYLVRPLPSLELLERIRRCLVAPEEPARPDRGRS